MDLGGGVGRQESFKWGLGTMMARKGSTTDKSTKVLPERDGHSVLAAPADTFQNLQQPVQGREEGKAQSQVHPGLRKLCLRG